MIGTHLLFCDFVILYVQFVGDCMKRRIMHDSDLKNSKLISDGDMAVVVKLNDGSILKVFNPILIQASREVGADIEKKILGAKSIANSPEILSPTSVVYSTDNKFMGYTMMEANGVDYNVYNSKLTVHQRCDLHMYARNHSKLERVLRKNPDIVFPDFCTCSNIILSEDEKVQFVDYDGLQVGGYKTFSISSSLGEAEKHFFNPKYCRNGFFNKELDKKSSIFLYFLVTFNVNLSNVGRVNSATGKVITLDDCFQFINLDDPDLCHKVWKTFQDNQSNEFLGDTVHYVADKYDMHVRGRVGNCYLKVLTKKR